ncbi:unnamed protein product [Candidula unifasciata]|uniref:Sodium-coupled monocarboxylate transporter 1 n=1 Tax=Candidula unifasciata TaxID=100452 RepID=A0A8S3ZDG6_9EUPU|nr:unnamed protein product [Candidula unifasciata]
MEDTVSLRMVDYVVIALTLSVSLGIGVLFAVKDFRNVNRTEYLLGGRRMFMLPVALSIFATFTSGISLMGIVTDIYMNGGMAAILSVGMMIAYVVAAFTIVPLLYPLQYHSRTLRLFAVMVGILQTLCYMAIALLSPALALQAGANLPMWVSVGIVGVIGTVYTAIGGIKTVVWTDAFQGLVMIGGLVTIIIKGSIIVGGGGEVWKIARAGGRADFTNFDLDPRVIDTWWGGTIGTVFFWLATICSQSSAQRISAMKSMTEARKAFLLNGAIILMFGGLMLAVAWVMYAYFSHVRCDPFQGGLIRNANQLPPYFVMHALTDLPGMGGLYFSMIFSGSLSTVSSGISSLAANTVEDLLKAPLKNMQEATVTLITKLLVCSYGMLIIGLAYGASYLKGPVTNMMASSVGACGGPILGIFLLGALIPWSNKYGAIGGGVVSLVINILLTLANLTYGSNVKFLPAPTSDMCLQNSSNISAAAINVSRIYFNNDTLYKHGANQTFVSQTVKYRRYSFFLYNISFEWYGLIGTSVCLMLGIFISHCTRRRCKKVTDAKLLFPFVRRICLSRRFNDTEEPKDPEGNCKLILHISDMQENMPTKASSKSHEVQKNTHDVDNSQHAIL